MGWFEEQISLRKQQDDEQLYDSFANLAGAVVGKNKINSIKNDAQQTREAVDAILKYYHLKVGEIPEGMDDVDEQLEYLLRPHGIMKRSVNLEKNWYKDATGAMLAQKKSDGKIIALIPDKIIGYRFFDAETSTYTKVNKKNQDTIEKEALVFYKALPLKELNAKDLVKYIFTCLSGIDIVSFVVATLIITLVGLLVPEVNQLILSKLVTSSSMLLFWAITSFLVGITISKILITSIKALLMVRIETKLSVTVEAASMMRVLSMPANFFRDFASGDLASRTMMINELCTLIVENVLDVGLTSVFSLIYIVEIAKFAPALALPAIAITVTTIAFTIITTFIQLKITRKSMKLEVEESGLTYGILTGIQKIKLAGAEKRAFAKWANHFSEHAELAYNPPLVLKINSVITLAISLAGTIVLYMLAIASHVSTADYFAFNASYAMVSGSFTALASIAVLVAKIKPILEMIEPILKTVPEISEGKKVVRSLSGSVELNNISFKYDEKGPIIIDDISLKVKSGQYIAIVGKTGCGKSTLMRLLLGFEKPASGAIYYDGKDIEGMDTKSLREKIGVVMQNGKLFQGDIFSNITITAPKASLDDAWAAAELAGIAEDIKAMPMGMHTVISEGQGGISGGQKQRLLIAAAIAPKPKILMFDEATSALDNITQKKISDALDSLKCTRIIIAHRLSTIKNCDRIIVLDKGKIIEDGTYEELINKNGYFKELVERQRVE